MQPWPPTPPKPPGPPSPGRPPAMSTGPSGRLALTAVAIVIAPASPPSPPRPPRLPAPPAVASRHSSPNKPNQDEHCPSKPRRPRNPGAPSPPETSSQALSIRWAATKIVPPAFPCLPLRPRADAPAASMRAFSTRCARTMVSGETTRPSPWKATRFATTTTGRSAVTSRSTSTSSATTGRVKPVPPPVGDRVPTQVKGDRDPPDHRPSRANWRSRRRPGSTGRRCRGHLRRQPT